MTEKNEDIKIEEDEDIKVNKKLWLFWVILIVVLVVWWQIAFFIALSML
jgi:hypothetical protein